jgi:hypothetical protein
VNLSPIIREFLLTNEKLVIPGFGALINIYHPAELNKTTNTLEPPSKEIRFDARQKYDDRQLAEIIINKLDMDETRAIEIINNFVHTLEEQINNEGSALIEDVGSFSKEPSGYLTFQPQDEFINLTGTFGLTQFNLPAPASFNATKETIRMPESQSPEVKPKKRKWWIPAAVLLLLIGIFSLIYFTGLFKGFVTEENEGKSNIEVKESHDRIVFGSRASPEKDTLQEMVRRKLEEHTSREKALSYRESENKSVENKLAESKPAESKPVEVIPPAQESAPLIGGPYHIIAGSFRVPANAERQKLKLERSGFTPVILPPKNNFVMVSLGSYKSRGQAVAALKSLREKTNMELWVMKM